MWRKLIFTNSILCKHSEDRLNDKAILVNTLSNRTTGSKRRMNGRWPLRYMQYPTLGWLLSNDSRRGLYLRMRTMKYLIHLHIHRKKHIVSTSICCILGTWHSDCAYVHRNHQFAIHSEEWHLSDISLVDRPVNVYMTME